MGALWVLCNAVEPGARWEVEHMSEGGIQLELYRGTELLGRHTFGDEPIRVGRLDTNDLILEDERAAALHLVLERNAEGALEVVDLGSDSGTLLNGVTVKRPRALKDGDELLVGDTWIVVRLLGGRDGELDVRDTQPVEDTLVDATEPESLDEAWSLTTPDVLDLEGLDLPEWPGDDLESTFDGAAGRPEAALELEPGATLVGKYTVGERLRESSYGLVYAGQHMILQRDVEIHVLHTSRGASYDARTRYEKLIEELGEMRHPFLIDVFDSFELEGQVGVVTGTVVGQTLRERLIGALHAPISVDEIRAWLDPVLEVLGTLHARGHSFGGLSPEGIVRDEQGHVVVREVIAPRFSVVLSPHSELTPSLDAAHYLAPEWIASTVGIDGRADLYSIGAIAFEMLTSHTLFDATEVNALLAAQLDALPEWPEDLEPERARLLPILRRALAKHPDDRFDSAAAMRQGLQDPDSVEPPRHRSGVFRHIAVMLLEPETTDEFDTASVLEAAASGHVLAKVQVVEHQLKPDPRNVDATPASIPPTETHEKVLKDVFDSVREERGRAPDRDPDAGSPMKVPKPRDMKRALALVAIALLLVAGSVLLFLALRPTLGGDAVVKVEQESGEVARLLGQVTSGERDVVLIPGGPARVGGHPLGGAWSLSQLPERLTEVSPFVIDRTEVSRGAYEACVEAHRCPDLPEDVRPRTSRERMLPAVQVSWKEADAYCRFVRMRLPTEAEWEKAARGTRGRAYPWGEETRCDVGNVAHTGCDAGNRRDSARVEPTHSETLDISPYGVLHMGGNVWEWTADWYTEPSLASPQEDVEPEDGSGKVVKGGDFASEPRPAFAREWNRIDARSARGGFRCVRSLPEVTRPGFATVFRAKHPPNHRLSELLLGARKTVVDPMP